MTPNEHDTPETSEDRGPADLSPFAAGRPQETNRAIDDTQPDLPAMEPLPDPDALPDPGYPEMPTAAGGTRGGAPWPRRQAHGLPTGPARNPGRVRRSGRQKRHSRPSIRFRPIP